MGKLYFFKYLQEQILSLKSGPHFERATLDHPPEKQTRNHIVSLGKTNEKTQRLASGKFLDNRQEVIIGLIWNRISLGIRWRVSLPKQPLKSRSILQDRSRALRLFRKGKTHIIA